jgi:hypothetical protein
MKLTRFLVRGSFLNFILQRIPHYLNRHYSFNKNIDKLQSGRHRNVSTDPLGPGRGCLGIRAA